MSLSYRQVKDLYDVLHSAGATQVDLPTWAQQMQGDTGSDLYSAGLSDNLIKRASVGIDRALDWTGLPELGSEFGRNVGGLFGMGEQGAQIGQGLPRMAVNLAPLSFGPIGAGITGLLSGAETYTETGSPAAGLLSGITNATLPWIAGKAEQGTLAFLRSQGIKSGIAEALLPRLEEGQLANRWINKTTPTDIEAVSRLFPSTFGQTAASNIGGQLAAAGYMGASDVGQDVLAGRDVRNPFTAEMGLNLGLGQLPFALLHLGGKALGFGPKIHTFDDQGNPITRSYTSDDAANALYAAIGHTERTIAANKLFEDQKAGKGIDSIAKAENAPVFNEEQQKRYDDQMASLSKQEDVLKTNPNPENLQKLGEISQQKDEAIREAASQGASLGVTSSPKGYTLIKGETTFHSPDRGFRVVNVTDPQGATYADGSPMQVGDKVGFSTGKYEPKVNGDATNKDILLPPKQFYSKLKDRQFESKTATNQPELPIQNVALDLHQHLERTRQLSDLEKQLSVAQTLADKTEILGHVNDIRDQLGFDRVDLPTAIEKGAKAGAKTETASIQAIIEQTKRGQAIDLKGTQALHDRIKNEVEFESELRQHASPGSDEAAVIDYYDSLSKKATGRRQQFLSEENGVSPFWKKAMELASKGEMTKERMQNAVETAAEKGKGLQGRNQKKQGEESIFKVPNDPASLQLLADSVRKATAEITNTPVGKVISNIFRFKTRDVLTGVKDSLDTSLPTIADVAEAGVDSGMFDDITDERTLQFAKDFHDPRTEVGAQVERVMGEINKAFSHPPESFGRLSGAPGRIEEKQPSAGGDFVWGMQSYDPLTNKLGKHTLPKTGVLNEQAFKTAAGRNGKPLQDVEIEMMKAVDKAINGGAFKDGMVDVKKLDKVLGENPVQVHVYGQDGKENPQKARFDELMHWYDSAKSTWNSNVKEWENNAAWMPQTEEQRANLEREAVQMGMPKEDASKYTEMLFLKNQGKDHNTEGPRATSYYNSISPFDTKKYPVVRVDVSLPGEGASKQYSDAAIQALTTEGTEANRQGEYGGKDLAYWRNQAKKPMIWTPDNLHENLPNTLGWAMVQFVPGDLLAKHNLGKYGELKGSQEKVMFVGEQQSRWGQEYNKIKRDEPTEGYIPKENSVSDKIFHPLLPIQHLLVLKAAISEAARRGVNKMVVSDGETAMMTEMHDKNTYVKYPVKEGAVPKPIGESYTFNWDTKLPQGWSKVEDINGRIIAKDANGNLFYVKAIDGRKEDVKNEEDMKYASPGTGLARVQLYALPVEAIRDRPSQEGGMRLHYDTTLSSAAKKLTGSEGEVVDLGTHKNARDNRDLQGNVEQIRVERAGVDEEGEELFSVTNDQGERNVFNDYREAREFAEEQQRERIPGSPVFRNPDGTPKSSITGRLYDLSSIQDTARQQGGLTLGDPSRSGQPEQKSFVPIESQKPIHNVLTGSGTDMANHLLSSPDKEYRGLAKDILAAFPEGLKKHFGQVSEGFGLAATQADENSKLTRTSFNPSVLEMNRINQDTIILHELGHALSLHLLEKGLSPVLEKQLESIRKRAIDALPKKLKDQYNKAQTEDFLAKSQGSGDKDMWDELAPSKEGFSESDRQILYGLLNHKELISQSWSSDTFKNYLKKLPGKVNGLKAFVNWTKALFGFGDRHDSLLHELIETSHSLMSHGEFLTSAEEYGHTWFDMQGKGEVYGQAQTQRGIELLEAAKDGITSGQIAGTLDSSQGRANPELNHARSRVDQILQDPEDLNHQGIKDSLAEWGHKGTTDGIDEMVVNALDEGHDMNDALESMPLPQARYIYEKLKDQKDIVDMLQSATAKKNEGVLNLANPKVMRGPLAEVGKRIDRMLEQESKEEESAHDLLGLSAVTPFGFLKSQLSHAPGKIEEKVQDDKPQDGKIPIERSWLSRFLEPMGQFAARFPEFAEIVSKGFQLVSNGRILGNASLKIFGANLKSDYLDVTDKESVAHMKKMMSNPHLADGVRRWIWENNKKGGDSVVMLDEGDPEIAKLRQRYTKEQWEIVRDFVTKQGLSRQKFNSDKLAFLQQISAVRGGGIISESGLKTGENIAIADAMFKAVQAMKDPLGAEGAKAQFQSIRDKLKNPEDFLQLLEYSKGEVELLGMVKETLDKNPFWAPAQRMEQFLVEGRKPDKSLWTHSFSSKKEAEIEIKKRGITLERPIKDQWEGKEDESFQVPGLTPDMIKRAKQIEQTQIKLLSGPNGLIKNADDLEKYYQSSIPTQMAREASEGSMTSGLNPPSRTLSKGAEDLPWLRNHIVGIQRESRFLARQLLQAQANTYLKHPDLRENDQLRNDLSTHFENILHPDPQLAQKVTRFASTWFMGFNLASTLVNATQPFLTHVSELTAMTGRPLESYRRVTRALKEAIAGTYSKKGWATEDHKWLMEKTAESGARSLSMYDDEAQDHEAISTGLLRALDKQKPQTLGQKLSSAAGVYTTVGMMPFKAVEQINASAALLAGFDYYREQGLGREDALEKAETFNRGVNYSGGRGQRPVLAFGGRGAFPRGSAMLSMALQSYVLGTTGQIARYLQSGLFRPKGLTPYETYSARKAAAQMLGTQLAAAGLLGLPFVSGAIALLDKLFPEIELNKKIREGVGNFLSTDHENGSPLSDIAMTGVPSMMGWDLQSRLSMGNTLPGVSEVNGFQPENLIGPVANIVRNFVSGVQGWAQGDPGATGKFLPPAIGKAIATAQSTLTDGGAIRDYQGRPLSSPTVGEQIGQGLGFQPKRLSDQNAAARILKQTTDVQNQEQRQERQEMAQEVLKGNYGTVRQAILQKMQSDKNYNPEDAVKAIAQNVEDSTLPRDLRREGDVKTAGQRTGLLSSFSNLSSSGSVSEVQRLQLRQGVEQKLGLVRPQSGELKVAMLMDQLKQAQPDLTRVQLKQAAQQLLRRSQLRMLEMSQE